MDVLIDSVSMRLVFQLESGLAMCKILSHCLMTALHMQSILQWYLKGLARLAGTSLL